MCPRPGRPVLPTTHHGLLEAQAPPQFLFGSFKSSQTSLIKRREKQEVREEEEREQPDKTGCSQVSWPRCALQPWLLLGISACCALFINNKLWKLENLPQDTCLSPKKMTEWQALERAAGFLVLKVGVAQQVLGEVIEGERGKVLWQGNKHGASHFQQAWCMLKGGRSHWPLRWPAEGLVTGCMQTKGLWQWPDMSLSSWLTWYQGGINTVLFDIVQCAKEFTKQLPTVSPLAPTSKIDPGPVHLSHVPRHPFPNNLPQSCHSCSFADCVWRGWGTVLNTCFMEH